MWQSRADVIQATAEERRRDRAAALDLRRQELQLEREQRQERQQQRTHRRYTRRQARAEVAARAQRFAPRAGRVGLIAGPILAPMAVAWIGQIQFATDTLGWPLVGAVVFAAAWELTTAFAGWMFHQARADGDRGTLFRFATWVFAASAGAMNYWHAQGEADILSPTPKAVSYGAMSLVGIGLWELYASLIHRRKLRAEGKLPPARPRFGAARWLRYPRITWRAWSLTIRHQIPTSEQAWSMAVAMTDQPRPAAESGAVDQPPVRMVVGRTVVIRDRSFTRPGDHARRPVLTTPFGGFSLAGTTRATTQRPPEPVVDHRPDDHPGDRLDDRSTTLEPTTPTTPATTPPAPETTARNQPARAGNARRNRRPTPEENTQATARYIESCKAGTPLSERDLAAEFGRSKGWARDRIQAAGPQQVVRPGRPPESDGGRPEDDHMVDQPAGRPADHSDRPVDQDVQSQAVNQ